MGYTTEFEGSFKFASTPPAEVILALRDLADGDPPPAPNTPWPKGYCQWTFSKDRGGGAGISWDGGEKFYDYVEWLQAIIDNILNPAGVFLSGSVRYQGEDLSDAGTLEIVDGRVVQRQMSQVIADLEGFKEFVLKSEHGKELLVAYKRAKGG